MQNKQIFNISLQEIEQQCNIQPSHCDKNSPLPDGEYLEPCIRGAHKILQDKSKREMMKRIYRR